MQLAAYKYMLEQQGYNIAGCIVLQLNKKEIGYDEYPIILCNEEHKLFMDNCLNTFLSLVFGYHNIYRCENMYNNIFK